MKYLGNIYGPESRKSGLDKETEAITLCNDFSRDELITFSISVTSGEITLRHWTVHNILIFPSSFSVSVFLYFLLSYLLLDQNTKNI